MASSGALQGIGILGFGAAGVGAILEGHVAPGIVALAVGALLVAIGSNEDRTPALGAPLPRAEPAPEPRTPAIPDLQGIPPGDNASAARGIHDVYELFVTGDIDVHTATSVARELADRYWAYSPSTGATVSPEDLLDGDTAAGTYIDLVCHFPEYDYLAEALDDAEARAELLWDAGSGLDQAERSSGTLTLREFAEGAAGLLAPILVSKHSA